MPCTPAPLHSGPIAGPLHREVGAHQIHTQAVSGSCSKETAPICFLVSPSTGYLFLLHQHSSSCTGPKRYGTIDELNLMQGKLARIHKNKFILEFQTKSPQAGGGRDQQWPRAWQRQDWIAWSAQGKETGWPSPVLVQCHQALPTSQSQGQQEQPGRLKLSRPLWAPALA